jgi:hypothetical protein
MDVKDTTLLRRIGPCRTLESAKQACFEAIEGRLDIGKRAGYPRRSPPHSFSAGCSKSDTCVAFGQGNVPSWAQFFGSGPGNLPRSLRSLL